MTQNIDRTKEAEEAMERGKDLALTAACLVVLQSAVNLAPIDMGQLKGSLHYKVLSGKDMAYVGTNVEHAPYQEFGTGILAEGGIGRQTPWRYQNARGEWVTTSGTKPQPYLRPAFDNNKDRIKTLMKKKFKEALERGLK